MLKAFGVTHVILGHSERRHIFGETDELIGKKVRAALRHDLVPLLCVGETQQEHAGGARWKSSCARWKAALQGLQLSKLGVS